MEGVERVFPANSEKKLKKMQAAEVMGEEHAFRPPASSSTGRVIFNAIKVMRGIEGVFGDVAKFFFSVCLN